MLKQKITSIDFKLLKGLHDVTINFDDHLTAIMGVNGIGKTTVIHALACLYEPETAQGSNYKFPLFFPPNTDSTWKDSDLVAHFEINGGLIDRQYRKLIDRWAPRYKTRPKRNVYYVGIDTCLPEIERLNQLGAINYKSTTQNDDVSKKIITLSSQILNIDYEYLINNTYKAKNFIGVAKREGLKYSSLSMGTGEQRTIKIMHTVLTAEPYSLILIDEIDLLLHECALRNLVKELYNISDKRHLQIVFTTHSLSMQYLTKYVSLQYIRKLNDAAATLEVYNMINDDIIFNLSGEERRSYRIFVEDDFSKAVVKSILRSLGKSALIQVMKFGSTSNAFTISAGLVIENADLKKVVVVLDGDIYKNEEDKLNEIKKKLTGTESDIEEKQLKAVNCIMQYALPDGKSPEQFIYELLVNCGANNNEIVCTAKDIGIVSDKHDLIRKICAHLQETEEAIVKDIINLIDKDASWGKYIEPIRDWIASIT